MITGAVIGGGTGAIAGATVGSQEQVEVAPVHLYEINKVLLALQHDYLAMPDVEERTLRLVRQLNPGINFVPAVPNGNRYSPGKTAQPGGQNTDVNLVLSELRVLFAGKAEDDPRITLTVHTQWTLTKYDAATNLNGNWDVLTGNYESKKHLLSEWLADDGALLKARVDEGLEVSLTHAFSDLGGQTAAVNRTAYPMEDSL